MLNNLLKKKKIIISAGASGIGLASVKLLLSHGATVYICDIDKKHINKLKRHTKFNKKLFIFECDASKEIEVKRLFKYISNKTDKIDGLINNIGIAGPTAPLDKINSDDWEKTLHINAVSYTHLTLPTILLV